MRELKLLNTSRPALVDDDDYERVNELGGWYARKVGKDSVQIVRDATSPEGEATLWSLKRTIMGNPEGMYVRFTDGDQYNNQKKNLKVMTPAQSVKLGGFLGKPKKVVKYDRKRKQYVARVRINNRYKILGRFKTKAEAQWCYDEYMKQLGEDAQCPTTKSE